MRATAAVLMLLIGWGTNVADAAQVDPRTLPREEFTLRDGRHFVGRYDEQAGVLWIEAPGSPRIAIAMSEFAQRKTLAEQPKRTDTTTGVAQRSPSERENTATAFYAKRAEVERLQSQLDNCDRRLSELDALIIALQSGLVEWAEIYKDAEDKAKALRPSGIGFQNNSDYNLAKMRIAFAEARAKLERARDQYRLVGDKREQTNKELHEARRELAALPQPSNVQTSYVYILGSEASPSDDRDQTIAQLREQVEQLTRENEQLRAQLEARPQGPEPKRPAEDPLLPQRSESGTVIARGEHAFETP